MFEFIGRLERETRLELATPTLARSTPKRCKSAILHEKQGKSSTLKYSKSSVIKSIAYWRIFPLFTVLILLVYPSIVYSQNLDWLEPYGYVLIGLDWGQTHAIDNGGGYYEKNPILGRSPDQAAINSYFALSAAFHAMMQDTKYRDDWNLTHAIARTLVVVNNRRIGIRIQF